MIKFKKNNQSLMVAEIEVCACYLAGHNSLSCKEQVKIGGNAVKDNRLCYSQFCNATFKCDYQNLVETKRVPVIFFDKE